MNINSFFEFVESRTNFEQGSGGGQSIRDYRLDRMKVLCKAFGNPQESCRSVHIAGSKGKGSTAAFTAALLRANGYRVGLYSSPHVLDFRERFLVNGDFPEDQALAVALELTGQLKKAEEPLEGSTGSTTFELLTLFAFMLFRHCRCDVMVIETGLGGRLDATNVMTRPDLVVLTPIELEHRELLGQTLAEIAAEKAGIIKQGIPVVSARQAPEVRRVFRRKARDMQSQLVFLDNYVHSPVPGTPPVHIGSDTARFVWTLNYTAPYARSPASRANGAQGTERQSQTLSLHMGGKVQAENAALALLSLETLGEQADTRALSDTTLPGRFELVPGHPLVILDGAHTVHSVQALEQAFRSVCQHMPGSRPILLFGCVDGKDSRGMARVLCGNKQTLFHHVLVSTPGTYKKSSPARVADHFRNTGSPVTLVREPGKALEAAKSMAGANGPILVTGSFYMAGEIARLIRS